ncbi:MAG: glycosyl hydrolase [Microscillaceae bacterium]|jgi:photosystem II stability/assembly factor-like uncharacterized protein|nr:glycosyl hydrolase [Microscillaceae bacterium]
MKKILLFLLLLSSAGLFAQNNPKRKTGNNPPNPSLSIDYAQYFKPLKWRNIGPFRGGRSVTACGVIDNPLVYYMGTCGGGVWKTEDAGVSWFNISDGFFKTGSVGSVAVADSDPNVVYVGMGEHAPRGVMTSYGDGVYKSTDAGRTWQHLGLEQTRHISWIRIHPQNPDIVYVAAQGALHGPNPERGVFKSIDGGKTWKKTLYVDENSGCADLVIDPNNPRILYATMWDHRRLPWLVQSGGKGSGLYKSTDGGETWQKLSKGIPEQLGKMSISISKANSNKVYVLIESDTEKELCGLFVSENRGESFTRVSKDHRLTQRAWYYIEVFADPNNENVVYVLNSPGLKSIDGGSTWSNIRTNHGDYHQLWINPKNSQNMIMADDGGACITFNGGYTWSLQSNQPTAQFYRVNADNLFPYNLYGGQQDNSSVKISSRNLYWGGIGEKNWTYSAGGESAFLAFDPNNPTLVMGGSYQGTIELLNTQTWEGKPMMVSPIQYQALQPKDMKYRFNWNAPIIYSQHEANAFYHAGNILFKTTNGGITWQAVSPDLTRNDKSKQGISGQPYTNEGAGGENYGTIAYVVESQHEKGVIYTGSDDGLVQITKDGGKTWTNITPPQLTETLVNCIEVSPHNPATVYIATTRYKVNDFAPSLYKSSDYGKTWAKIDQGIPYGAFTRCIREDKVKKGLLYVGTETGLYISMNDGATWQNWQLGLPITPITDLKVHQNDLVAATMGRSFWILDDLSILQQLKNDRNPADLHLYAPEEAHRVNGYGTMSYEIEDNPTSYQKIKFSGDNPSNGVVIFYQLPKDLPKTFALQLEIRDDKGQLVRTFYNKPDSSFVGYPGGPDAEPMLPAKAGLNRFVWDMRYPILLGIPTVYIEGSYESRKVKPGKYTLTLKYEKQTATAECKILANPNIQVADNEYTTQQEWQKKVEDDIIDIHSSVLRVRKIKKQLEDFLALLPAQATYQKLRTEGDTIIARLSRWEAELVQNKSQSNDDVINYVNKLSADYIFVKGEMDANIPTVTDGQKSRFAELNAIWLKHKQTMQNLINQDIMNFNEACKTLSIPKIIVPEK